MKRIQLAIFGTGGFYKKGKEKLNSIDCAEICIFVDNNVNLWGTMLDGILIIAPTELDKIQYDYIVLMSIYAADMYKQLINMKVEATKILYWEKFIAKFANTRKVYYAYNAENSRKQTQVLIMTADIGYDGGTMAAIYAAMCLQSRNYKVDLAASGGNKVLIQEINEYGINVTIYSLLPYIKEEEWIDKYDVIIVNIFSMIQCACEISQYKPVLWWIHEASVSYNAVLKQFEHYSKEESLKYTNIYAVSRRAQENFNTHFPDRVKKILNYGIPDVKIVDHGSGIRSRFVFAIIGYICELKAQDVFLQAAEEISAEEPIEFWLIGDLNKDAYGCNVIETAKQNPNVKILGILSRKEIYKRFADIDVVVCPSREDSLPIVMTEAMMFHKVCIASDKTGTAEYIVDGENGFIVEADNVSMLKDKMQWTVDHRDKLETIGNKARETYEKYFSMAAFGGNLEKAINETVIEWTIKR